jgi:protein phosphatase
LGNDLVQIVRCALETDVKGFNELVEEATRLLSEEGGRVGSFEVTGRLVKARPRGHAIIIGDLHGDLESLIDVLKESRFLDRMSRNRGLLMVFLGDYGDRGAYSAEVYYTVLKLKVLFPEQVILMRGNHEGPEDLTASPHDLPRQFQARFGEKGAAAYAGTRRLFEHLCNAMLVEGQYLLLHGGPPTHARTVDDLAYAHERHPKQSLLEDMLWSDPDESISGTSPSPRGAGRLFGKDVTIEALRRFGARILIRGHEPCHEGYKISHEGRIMTLFSCKSHPYFNAHAAYLEIDLAEKPENAEQLVPHIHKF